MFKRLVVFLKAQLSAGLGGIVDYLTMIFFTEIFDVPYTISIAIGGVIGAVVNFHINNKWTFKVKDSLYKKSTINQLIRFVAVVINSIALKSAGTYLLSTWSNFDYKISRIIIDLIVSLAFNYTLQKYWVFAMVKKADTPGSIKTI